MLSIAWSAVRKDMMAQLLGQIFHTFFFLTMKPSGFPLAPMKELTVHPFATAKILLILLCR